MKKFSFLVVLFLTIFSSYSQTAALDPTFNSIDIGFGNGDGANSDVNCSAVQSDAKILIAGSFTTFNSVSNNYITRLNPNGSLDTSFDSGIGANGTINSLAIQSDGKIIIAGSFTSFDGNAINRIARLNVDGSLDTSFTIGTGASALIYSIAVQSDDKILIGGNFTTYNGTARNRVARLNADGTLDTTFSVGTGANSSVYSFAVQSDEKIILGGNFTSFNGTSRTRIARLLANGILDTSFSVGSGANGIVHSIDIQSDGKVLIGGAFTSYNANLINRMARLNDNGSLDSGFSVGTGADDTVFAVELKSDGSILIGGAFTDYDGNSRNSIARLFDDGSLDTDFVIESGANAQVKSITLQADSKIIIGGQFTTYDSFSKNYVARLNVNGSLDVDFAVGTGANNEVYAMAVQTDGKIIIGGAFTSYNNSSANYIARLNADGTLDSTFNIGSGADNPIYSVLVQPDGKILVGGYFNSFNENVANYIVRLNSDGSLDSTFITGTGANGIVYSIALQQDGKIVIGGEFSAFNEISMNNIARLNVDGSLDTSFTIGTGADWYINSVKIQSDNKILIGGGFSNYNDISRNYIARLHSDGTLDVDFNTGAGADSDVVTMAVQADGKIIIGGYFTNYDETSRNYIARLNSNGSLDNDFVVGSAANSEVFSLTLQEDNKVIIGGSFTSYNGIPVNRLARLNTDGSLDTNFTVGSGANGQINTLLIQPNGKILIGGQFTGYNNIGRNRILRINGFTNPPTALSQTFCGVAYIENLIASGSNLKWYASNSSVEALNAIEMLTTGTYYVSQTVNTIESERVPVSIIVSSNEVPVFTQVEPIAQGAIISPLPTTSNNGIQGTWTPELNTLETTTYTFTPTNSCGISVSMTIVVNASAPVFTPVNPICSGETLNTLPTLSNNGIEGTWSPALNNMATTTYTFTPNAEGISTVTMTIIVNPSSVNTTTVSSCDSYTWGNNGQTYTTSGTYTGTTTNCITEQLVLTINNSSSNTTTITACETFTWEAPLGNGLTYTISQTAINVTTNGAGCPNEEILNLTIIPIPDAPQNLACYQSAEFDNQTCQWNIVGEQPAQPTELACYESVGTFNTTTCQWDIVGEQPEQPTELACYQSVGTFNTTTCQWNIVGEQPVQPTELACYQSVGEFNTTTCQWDIVGEQPAQPIQVNCWDEFVFDSGENCSWVNIGIQPSTPMTQATQTFAPGATVSNLVAVGSNLNWYNQENGGNALESNIILTQGTYYVSQTINGCESERVLVEVNLYAVLCSGSTVADLVVSGGISVRWYSSFTATTSLSSTTQLSSRVYYFTQTIEGIQTAKIPVTVTIDLISNATSISGASGTICYDSTKILSLNATNVRGIIQWYSSSSLTGPFLPIPEANSVVLNTGNLTATTYYNAVVTNGVCPSRTTTTATVSVRSQSVSGTISGGGVTVCSVTNRTVLTSSGHVGTILWQSSTNNIDFTTISPNITSTSLTVSNLSTTTYYRTLVTNGVGCAAVASNSVSITVRSVPNAGVISGPSSIPNNTRATLELTNFESGSTLQWMYGATLTGTYFNGGQANNTSNSYTTSSLTRDTYYRVTVTKDGCTSRTTPFLVDVNTAVRLAESTATTPFEVIAYPNPSSSEFTIQTSAKGAISVKVYDMQGRLVENADTNKVGSKLVAGTYNVIVNQGANTKLVRVIKQ